MSYVFVSYSKKDSIYARRLEKKLISEGFDVWIDERIESGENWWSAIYSALKECGAFIVIMTPEAEVSGWVAREVSLAADFSKPAFPLLLEGDSNINNSALWSLYTLTQFEDVRDKSLPRNEFYNRIAKFVQRQNDVVTMDIAPDIDELTEVPELDFTVTNFSAPVSYYLRILHGSNTGQAFHLQTDTLYIGRSSSCDIHLDDSSISRHHAQLVKANSGYMIQDLNSKNGTSVNADRIPPSDEDNPNFVTLQNADYIRVGNVLLEYNVFTREHDEER